MTDLEKLKACFDDIGVEYDIEERQVNRGFAVYLYCTRDDRAAPIIDFERDGSYEP